jgi:hypothetical protein
MKKTALVLLVLALVLTFTACRNDEYEDKDSGFAENIDAETIEKDSLGVSVDVPDNWIETSSSFQGAEIRHYMSPAESNSDLFSESVAITSEVLEGTPVLDDYVSANLENLKITFTDFEVISEPTHIKAGEYDASNVVFKYSSGAYDIVIDQTFLLSGNTAYIIICNATSETYDTYKDIFTQAKESFKIN